MRPICRLNRGFPVHPYLWTPLYHTSSEHWTSFWTILTRASTAMAASLQLPMASSIPSSSSPSTTRPIFKTHCSMKPTCSAKIPMSPINPKDPFLSKLASVAATSPERLLQRPSGSDSLPFLDLFDSPKLMATPAQVRPLSLSREFQSQKLKN